MGTIKRRKLTAWERLTNNVVSKREAALYAVGAFVIVLAVYWIAA